MTVYFKNRSATGSVRCALIVAAGLLSLTVAPSARAQMAATASATTGGTSIEVTGVWIDHTGRGAIEIVPCGTRVCGYVYWVKDAVSKQGQPLIDSKNPDAKRRNKPICGTQILINLVQEQAAQVGHVWGGGSIYDPEEGAMFDAEIKLKTANELSVLGYLGLKFMGESFIWKRAPVDLARCGPPRI